MHKLRTLQYPNATTGYTHMGNEKCRRKFVNLNTYSGQCFTHFVLVTGDDRPLRNVRETSKNKDLKKKWQQTAVIR